MNFAFTIILKATIILILSGTLLVLFRNKSASLRHWILSLTLLGLLVLPAFIIYMPAWEVETELAHQLNPVYTNSPPAISTAANQQETSSVISEISESQNKIYAPEKMMAPSPASSLPTVLLGLWSLGVLFFLGKVCLGIIKIRQLTKSSQTFEVKRLHSNIPILSHSAVHTPMTWGFYRPVILLPDHAKNWPEKTLHTVLQHETAHIQRGDYLMHLISWLTISLYWFHPLVWWFKNRQILEREKACDEYVLSSGLSNQDYASQLIQVARNLSASSQTSINYSLPMAQLSQIKKRIMAILEFQNERFRFTKVRQFQWSGFYTFSILILAAFSPIKPVKIMEAIAPGHQLTNILQESIEQSEEKNTLAKVIANQPKDINPTVVKRNIAPIETLPQHSPQAIAVIKDYNRSIPALLPAPQVQKTIPEPESSLKENAPKGYHSKWKKGKSTFEVWTIGNINFTADLPYMEVDSPEDMIIIEETRRGVFGTKKYKMVITKVPYNGGLIIDFIDGKPNSWNGSYLKDDPLYLFFIDDEFRFGTDQQQKWLANKFPEVSAKTAAVKYNNKDWEVIDQEETIIKKHFAQRTHLFRKQKDLPENDFESLPYWKMLKHKRNPPFDFSSVPTKAPSTEQPRPVGKTKKIGRHKKLKGSTGGNVFDVGQKFGTVIHDIPKGTYLKNFNFHLKVNDFEKITFRLDLYSVNSEGILEKINPMPIAFETSDRNWIRVNLEQYKLSAEGTILAMLSLNELDGRIGLDHIVFSLAKSKQPTFHESTGKEWGFWEGNFAAYFDAITN